MYQSNQFSAVSFKPTSKSASRRSVFFGGGARGVLSQDGKDYSRMRIGLSPRSSLPSNGFNRSNFSPNNAVNPVEVDDQMLNLPSTTRNNRNKITFNINFNQGNHP